MSERHHVCAHLSITRLMHVVSGRYAQNAEQRCRNVCVCVVTHRCVNVVPIQFYLDDDDIDDYDGTK